ncbi:transmembrane protein 229B isoform X3 [Zalophus californianus]|uniref:Transmembrane protein 229B isoform X3 n=1 Tax=Zalophus californianus TaxID=9704 RepID=A0A6J2B9Z5_ZALCA|nr:transmembrane protein 229B isoform X3 [Zalophus californianus]
MLAHSGSATPHGPWPSVGGDLQDAHSGRCTRSPHNSCKLGGEGRGLVLSPLLLRTPQLQAGRQGQGPPSSSALQPPAPRPGPREGALPGARGAVDSRRRAAAGRATGSAGQRTQRASGRAGEQGVKPGQRQRACQTRACAVCTASVLWGHMEASGPPAKDQLSPGADACPHC